MEQSPQKRPANRHDRFQRTNPPPDRDTALARVDILSADVASIEAKLDHMDPESFQDDAAYERWRSRAIGALAHTKEELTFLRKWIDTIDREEKRPAPRQSHGTSELQKISQIIRARAGTLAMSINALYVRRYSKNDQPVSVAAAHAQKVHLTEVRQALQKAFGEISNAWTSHPLRRDDLPGVKAPLQAILSDLETEMGVVKEYIRLSNQKTVNPSWQTVCANALTRAVAEGFKLTDEEQETLKQIQNENN